MKQWQEVVLALARKEQLPCPMAQHVPVPRVSKVQASQGEEGRIETHVTQNRCSMEIKLPIISSRHLSCSCWEFELQCSADMRYFGGGLH